MTEDEETNVRTDLVAEDDLKDLNGVPIRMLIFFFGDDALLSKMDN